MYLQSKDDGDVRRVINIDDVRLFPFFSLIHETIESQIHTGVTMGCVGVSAKGILTLCCGVLIFSQLLSIYDSSLSSKSTIVLKHINHYQTACHTLSAAHH
jgi:hypothetical protein